MNQNKHIPKLGHFGRNYLGKEIQRFYSYRMQLFYAIKSQPQTILLIGKGDGIVESILRNLDIKVTTLDISKDLTPDFVGTVESLPFKNKSFDVSICCQVLEHLPFEQFRTSLRELRRVTREYLILSLPDARRFLSLRIQFFSKLKFNWQSSFFRIRPLEVSPMDEHYWEIGIKGTGFKKIKKEIVESGWEIIEIQRVIDFPYHTFYYLA